MRALFRCTLIFCFVALPAAAQNSRSTLGNTKDDDERPAQPPLGGADLALFRALLWATEPNPVEVRAQAVEDLGLLGDSRALNPLATFIFDPNPAIWQAALRAIGVMRHPRAEEILSNIIRHPTLGEGHKLKALEYLPFQNTPSAIRFISLVPRTPTLSTGVQNLGRRIMLEIPPHRTGSP